ncbi:hypothetical protein HBI73_199630 [Parastagonospora nodorum]|nr:hypothetical protein HBI10_067590 [Parastagonospora nodorum]KAH4118496.1 hypothetical protein HBH47_139550 [Parastagonospora nodorum]KAH4188002.1 hypothetical protein HBH42_153450 [Parastagonospora nodorum]KAH5034597.1 hypothetical protein HBI75_091000 [Parastagonospora nodorum]KAH5064937.1 hypothetical protein HBI73_199630 [Parastagonospora nodorum]
MSRRPSSAAGEVAAKSCSGTDQHFVVEVNMQDDLTQLDLRSQAGHQSQVLRQELTAKNPSVKVEKKSVL